MSTYLAFLVQWAIGHYRPHRAAQQLAGADLASPRSSPAFDSILGLAGRLSSMPLGRLPPDRSVRFNVNEVSLRHLRRAIEVANAARNHGNHPFGALLVGADGKVLAEAENTVVTGRDPTGHAELNLVRIASAQFDREVLPRSTLFTSTEPCAMCAGAIFWSGIGKVVYALSEEGLYTMTGARIAQEAMKIPSREIFARCGRPVEVEGPALEEESKGPHTGFWEHLGRP